MKQHDGRAPILDRSAIISGVLLALFYAMVPVVSDQLRPMKLPVAQAFPVVIGAAVIGGTFIFTRGVSRFFLLRLIVGLCIAYLAWGANWFAWFAINRTMEDANAAVMGGPVVLLDTLLSLSETEVFRHRDDEFTGQSLWRFWFGEAVGFTAAAFLGAVFGGRRMVHAR